MTSESKATLDAKLVQEFSMCTSGEVSSIIMHEPGASTPGDSARES